LAVDAGLVRREALGGSHPQAFAAVA
jgi:hypothetical protein